MTLTARVEAAAAKGNPEGKELQPNSRHLDTLLEVVFRHTKQGFAAIRCFRDDMNAVVRSSYVPLSMRQDLLGTAVEDARWAANESLWPVVACVLPCTFLEGENGNKGTAEKNVSECCVIVAELDEHPRQAREKLVGVLGAPTLEVKSGGRWKNGGASEDRLHMYWCLTGAAAGADLVKLKRARRLVAQLAGGDPLAAPICHPMRLAGSWHRKAEPRLCEITVQNAEREIDLDVALDALIQAAGAPLPEEPRQKGPHTAPDASPDDGEDRRIRDALFSIDAAKRHVLLRSVAPAWTFWAVESTMDEIAHAAGQDPVEMRLKLHGDRGALWRCRPIVMG